MTKSELTKQLTAIHGSPILCLAEIAKYFRMGRERAADMMKGCRYEQRGRGMYFFAADVAERYMEQTEVF